MSFPVTWTEVENRLELSGGTLTGSLNTKNVSITGNLSVTGSITGNASSATKLQTARTIAISGGATGTSTSFDGSANITIPVTALDVSKATAGTLSTARGVLEEKMVKRLHSQQQELSMVFHLTDLLTVYVMVHVQQLPLLLKK